MVAVASLPLPAVKKEIKKKDSRQWKNFAKFIHASMKVQFISSIPLKSFQNNTRPKLPIFILFYIYIYTVNLCI